MNEINLVKYFFNPENFSEYLVSGSEKEIYIYDIVDNFKKKYKIDLNIKELVDCILYFSNNQNNNRYIYISDCVDRFGFNYSKIDIYTIDNKFIESLEGGGISIQLLLWYDKINDNHFIINITSSCIVMINLLNKKKIKQWDNKIKDFHFKDGLYKGDNSYIYNDNYLVTMNYDELLIFDLYNKSLFKKIKMNVGQKNKEYGFYEKYKLKNIVKWNNRYAISVSQPKSIYPKFISIIHIIDIEKGKVISKIIHKELNNVQFIKKLNHPIYGESLIIADSWSAFFIWGTKGHKINKINKINNKDANKISVFQKIFKFLSILTIFIYLNSKSKFINKYY